MLDAAGDETKRMITFIGMGACCSMNLAHPYIAHKQKRFKFLCIYKIYYLYIGIGRARNNTKEGNVFSAFACFMLTFKIKYNIFFTFFLTVQGINIVEKNLAIYRRAVQKMIYIVFT